MEVTSTYQDAADPSKVPCCKCVDESGMGVFAVSRVSKTDKNKDRSFFTCALGQSKGCGFFCWLEDVIVDPKTGLAKRKYIPPPEGAAKKTKQQTDDSHLVARIEVLEKEFAALKERLSKIEEQEIVVPPSPDNELLTPPPKSQKTTGGNKKPTRPRMLQ